MATNHFQILTNAAYGCGKLNINTTNRAGKAISFSFEVVYYGNYSYVARVWWKGEYCGTIDPSADGINKFDPVNNSLLIRGRLKCVYEEVNLIDSHIAPFWKKEILAKKAQAITAAELAYKQTEAQLEEI